MSCCICVDSLSKVLFIVHQFLLSNTYLQDWTLNAPRTDIISQNKEGLVSLPGKCSLIVFGSTLILPIGYLAIHILGLLTGTIVLPPSPSEFKRSKGRTKGSFPNTSTPEERPRQPGKTAIELCSYAILWWFFLYAANFVNLGQGVSRRLVSSHYVHMQS